MSYGMSGEQIETKLRPARLLLERGRFRIVMGSPLRETGS